MLASRAMQRCQSKLVWVFSIACVSACAGSSSGTSDEPQHGDSAEADERERRAREPCGGAGGGQPRWSEIELVKATEDRQIVEGQAFSCYYDSYEWRMQAWYRSEGDRRIRAWMSPGQAAGPNCGDADAHERRRELAREALRAVEVQTSGADAERS